MKRIAKGLIIMAVTLSSLLGLGAGTFAATTPAGGSSATDNEGGKQACAALTDVGVNCDAGVEPEDFAGTTIKKLLNLFSIIVGGVCVMMVILGGFKFVTSGGDADGIKSARNTIIYAAVGLAVVLLAQTIVFFVFAKANELQTTPPTTTTTVI